MELRERRQKGVALPRGEEGRQVWKYMLWREEHQSRNSEAHSSQ